MLLNKFNLYSNFTKIKIIKKKQKKKKKEKGNNEKLI
jgi:hypothetical protein